LSVFWRPSALPKKWLIRSVTCSERDGQRFEIVRSGNISEARKSQKLCKF
jgi:hypothetical protein